MESAEDDNGYKQTPSGSHGIGLESSEAPSLHLASHSNPSKKGGANDKDRMNSLEKRMDRLHDAIHGINDSLKEIMLMIQRHELPDNTRRSKAISASTQMFLSKSHNNERKLSVLRPSRHSRIDIVALQLLQQAPNEDQGRYESDLHRLLHDQDNLPKQVDIQQEPQTDGQNTSTEDQTEVTAENQAIDAVEGEKTERSQRPSAASETDKSTQARVVTAPTNPEYINNTETSVIVPQTTTTPPSPSATSIDLTSKDQYLRHFNTGQCVRETQAAHVAAHAATARVHAKHGEKNSKNQNGGGAPWSRKFFHPSSSAVAPLEVLMIHSDEKKIHPYSIRHDSKWRGIWDAFVMVWVVVDIVLTPLTLSFPSAESASTRRINITGMVVFFFDFVVQMLSSYETERGVFMSGPEVTIRHYFTGPWAIPDFLSWLPLEFIMDKTKFLGATKVLRLIKVSQLARRVHSAKKAGIFRFIRLIGIVLLVSHIGTCFWHWVADDWRNENPQWSTWPLSRQYAHCWALIIGCLNASPPSMHSPAEEITVACFMLVGNVIQASVFGSVAVLISSFDEEETEYNKKLISTYERCKFLDIPERLTQRIQEYYEHLYKETRSINTDADSFINELSPALICEVKFQLYREMLQQIPFFSTQRLDSSVIELLILHFRTVIYMQDDVVIRKGEYGDWMGFIGSKGSVGVLDPNSDVSRIIRVLRKGDYFGEMALLERCKRSTTAVALTWVQIHVLCRTDLDSIKDHYPDQAEILENEIVKYMKSKVVYK